MAEEIADEKVQRNERNRDEKIKIKVIKTRKIET